MWGRPPPAAPPSAARRNREKTHKLRVPDSRVRVPTQTCARPARGSETCGSSFQSPSHDLKLSTEHAVDRFRVRNMLLLQDALGQRVLVVGVEYGHRLLHNDGAMIEFLVHKVHCATRDLHSVSEGLLLRFESGECRQE